ncbi:uncharacterized protein LOC143027091 isoform X2 [Oratosquilla oratoria]|uniref:uncharacterized protein LOC143027091 isoform X2 n=1 Tax=Oratosquilla oratoria TaxID=337810 RepID=UPI003F75848B
MSLRYITTRRHDQDYLGDLDMQPVREVSSRVLNECAPEVPQETEQPSPKFHFVDVTIPGPPTVNSKNKEKRSPRGDKSKHKSSRKDRDRSRKSHRKRKENESPVIETSETNQEEHSDNFVHSATYLARQKELQQVTANAKKEFLVGAVSKGVPLWQKIPQSENLSGIGNAFQAQLCSKSADVTPQNKSRNKNRKIPKVYWEDVRATSNEPQARGSVVSSVNNIASPTALSQSVYHISGGQQHQSSAYSSSSIPIEYITSPATSPQSHPVSQTRVPLHIDQPSMSAQLRLTSRTGSSLSSHVNNVHPNVGTNWKDVGVRDLEEEEKTVLLSDSSPCIADQSSKLRNREVTVDLTGDSSEESEQKKNTRSRDVEEVDEENKRFKSNEPQNPSEEVEILKDDDNHQPYVMKRKFAGRLDGGVSSAITPTSWKAGDKAAKECFGALPKLPAKNIESNSEKQDGGDKKERKGKRERSETTRTQPAKKRRKPEATASPEQQKNKGPKVKHYDQSAVRKFLNEQRAQRMKERKLAQEQKEKDKHDKEERLKKLAEKTKELATVGKVTKEIKEKVSNPVPIWNQRQASTPEELKMIAMNSKGTQIEDDLYGGDSLTVQRDSLAWVVPYSPNKEGNQKKISNKERRVGACKQLETAAKEKSPKEREASEPKGKKSRGKVKSDRKDRRGHGNQETISNIISRTLEECNRQVISSGLSAASSVVTSLSCPDSDSSTTGSSSAQSSSAGKRKERAQALDLMAQRLKERIDQEEEYLRQMTISFDSPSNANDMQKRPLVGEQPTPSKLPAGLQNTQEEQRVSPPIQSHHTLTNGDHQSAHEVEPLMHLNHHQQQISSDIETMTLDEVVAYMTSLLPGNKGRTKNAFQDSNTAGVGKASTDQDGSGVSRKLGYPGRQLNEASKTGSIDKESQSHVLSKPAGKSSASTLKTVEEHLEEVPTLSLPSVPNLKLSGMRVDPFQQNSIQSLRQASRIPETPKRGLQEKGENHKGILISHEKTPRGVIQSNESLDRTDVLTFSKVQKIDEGGHKMQSAFHGYPSGTQDVNPSGIKERDAALSDTIDKQETWMEIENDAEKHKSERNLRFFTHNIQRYLSSVSEDSSISEGQVEEIDWQRIIKELDKRSYVPPEESEYSVQRKDLPEWIKPYIVLCETGNVDNFLQMSPKKKKVEIKGAYVSSRGRMRLATDNGKPSEYSKGKIDSDKENESDEEQNVNDTTLTEGLIEDLEHSRVKIVHEKNKKAEIKWADVSSHGRMKVAVDNGKQYEYSKGKIDSDKENESDEEQNLNDATLTEGLIEDLEHSRVKIVHERETQTSLSINQSSKIPSSEKSRRKDKRKGFKYNDFVELRRRPSDSQNVKGAGGYSQNKLVLDKQRNTDNCRENLECSSYGTPNRAVDMSETNQSQSENNLACLSTTEHSIKEVSLEEGKLESIQSSSQTVGGGVDSSNTLSSSVVTSHDITRSSTDSFQPHELLDKGYINFTPNNLRMRLNAELEYQDTVTEALNQLQEIGTMQTVAHLQQKHDLTIAETLSEQRKQVEARTWEEKKEHEKEVQRDEKLKHNCISNIEKLEREANERLAALEKDIRARAERILASAVTVPSQGTSVPNENSSQGHAGSQPEVIAAAAVAAVGATLTHWERLQATQKVESSKSDSSSRFTKSQRSSVSVTSSKSNQYSSFTSCSTSSSRPAHEVSQSGQSTVISESSVPEDLGGSFGRNRSLSSVMEEIPEGKSSGSLSEVGEVHTDSKISVSLDAENTESRKSASSVMEELNKNRNSQHSLSSDLQHSMSSVVEECNENKVSSKSDSVLTEDVPENIISKPSVTHVGDAKSRNTSSKQSASSVAEVFTQDAVSRDSISSVAELSQHRISVSYNADSAEDVSLSQHSIPEEFLSNTINSNEVVETENTINQGSSESKVASISVVQEMSALSGSVTRTWAKSSSSRQNKESASSSNEGSSQRMSSRSSKSKTVYSKTSSSAAFSSTDTNTKPKTSSKSVPSYSESFDAESTSESNESMKSLQKDLLSPDVRELPLVLSKNFTSGEGGRVPSSLTHGSSLGGSALGVTLNLMESLQKEEQVRQQHQRALLKLQERALIQEARWKLAALHAEGGPNVRKRERAILLQLREQRTHLRRLIEAQNLGAQQRRILLLQHQHLLATSSGSNISSTRAQFPITGSLPVTPRLQLQDLSASSSEPLEEFSLSSAEEAVSLRTVEDGRSKGRKEEEINRERRKLVEDRKRGGSFLEAKKSQEGKSRHSSSDERETGRVRSRLSQEKESTKNWKKENRRVKEKSPSPVISIQSTLKNEVAESSVAEESIEASMNDTQSSVTEEVHSDSASHSDLKSSVSDQVESDQVETEVMNKEHVSGSTPEELSKITGSVRTRTSTLEEDIKSYTQTATDKSIPTETSGSKSSASYSKSIDQEIQQSNNRDSGSVQSSVKSMYNDSFESGSLSELVHQRSSESKSSRTATAPDETETGSAESAASKSGSSSHQALLSSKNPPLPFRVPLSPRSPHRQNYKRYSSESDDSFTLSQNETASDLSDGEGRLFALKEQLAARKAEADKLKREKRRMRRERLSSQEQALKKQIASYDSFIQQARLDLEKEIREAQVNAAVKPVIKKPQVAETKKSRKTDVASSPERSEVSEASMLQDSSIRDSISVAEKKSFALDKKTQESDTEKEGRVLSSEESSEKGKGQDSLQELQDVSSRSKVITSQQDSCQESQSSTVSEEYSFEEETVSSSEQTSSTQSSPRKSLSRGSSVDTDHSPSQASSTETIVQSPTKHELPLADEDLDQGLSSHTEEDQKFRSTDSIKDGNQESLPQLPIQVTPNVQIDDVKPRASSEASSTEDSISEVISEVGSVESKEESQKKENQTGHSGSESASSSLSKSVNKISSHKSEELPVQSKSQEDVSVRSLKSITKSDEVSKNEIFQNEDQKSLSSAESNENKSSKSVQSESSKSQSHESKSAILASESNTSVKFTPHVLPKQQETKEHKEDLANDITQQVLKALIDDTKDFLSAVIHCKNKPDPLLKAELKTGPQVDVPEEIDFAQESESGKEALGFNISSPRTDQSSTFQAAEEVPLLLKHHERHKKSEETLKLSFSPRSNTEEQKDSCSPRSDKEASSSSKSQILKRVSDLIAESGQSPRSTSSVSVTPPLTPHMTFDLSPDEEEEPKEMQRPSSFGSSVEIQKDGKSGTDIVEAESPDKSVLTSAIEDAELDAASPSHDHVKASEYSLDLDIEEDNFAIDPDALTCKLMTLTSGNDKELDLDLDHQDKADDAEFAVEGIEGDWFDDDFWSSADARKKQQQLKAEEEKISAEIARLEELQKLQQQYPDLVIRDIPNKPPPPYSPPSTSVTPPSTTSSPSSSTSQGGMSPAVPTAPVPPPNQASGNVQGLQPQTPSNTVSFPHRLSKADLRKLATEIFHAVPSQKDEVMSVIEDTVSVLYDAMQEGQDPNTVQPPQQILQPSKTSSEEEEDDDDDDDDPDDGEGSARTFRYLLFSLGSQLLHQIYIAQNIPPPPPWIPKKNFPHSKTLFLVKHKSKARLLEYVKRQVEILLGWEPPAFKESMILRWAKKRRDLVDQVLVRELQSEEMSWTQYNEDEAAVKVQVSGEIFESLIEETAALFTVVIKKKISLM